MDEIKKNLERVFKESLIEVKAELERYESAKCKKCKALKVCLEVTNRELSTRMSNKMIDAIPVDELTLAEIDELQVWLESMFASSILKKQAEINKN